MSLSLSRVTQAWASALADLQPIHDDKLDVLLRVCGGADGSGAKDGDVLQRALPLSRYLETSSGKCVQQIVPRLVQLLKQLPESWMEQQNGPLQTQADFTQLMLDLRSSIRSSAAPSSVKQQLSSAVQHVLQALFATAAQQHLQQHNTWIKTGCNLLLRALTRSQQFVNDSMLPLLPSDAFALLEWLNDTAMGTQVAGAARAAVSSSANSAAVSSNGVISNSGHSGEVGRPSQSVAGSAAETVDHDVRGSLLLETAATQPAGKLLLRDDKTYLLLTKIVMTATGLSAEAAAVAAAAQDMRSQPAAQSSSNGPTSSAADAHAAGRATVSWGTAPDTADGMHISSCAAGGVKDPALLVQLLEWSGTKVKLAMQQLLEPAGSSDSAISREATSACAQLAAVLIDTLLAGPPLLPELEARLRSQVERLLETALAVGEAAVTSAAAAPEHDADADKVLALGGRILNATTPFVAAAVRRGSLEQQLELTSRLQQLMLAAAKLAGRHSRVVGPTAAATAANRASGAATVVPAGRGAVLGQILEEPGTVSSQHHPLHHPHNHSGRAVAVDNLRAGTGRLIARRAAQRSLSAGLSGGLHAGLQRKQRLIASTSWSQQPEFGPNSVHGVVLGYDGSEFSDELYGQSIGLDADAALAEVDLAHPWSWDVTQPLTTLSDGVKLSQLPLSCGIGGFLLARAAAEKLCEALAACWAAANTVPVRRFMLLPQGAAAEQMVTTLALGRLYVKSQADSRLGQLLLPLLADVISSTASGSSTGSSYHPGSAAGAGSAGDRGSSRDGVGKQAGSTAVAGAVVCALEGMASACVQHCKDTWLYDQALQLLLMMYREPTPLSLQLLAGRSAHPATAGLLADALHLLAVGMEGAPQRARQDLRMKLLLLYSNVAARVGGGGSSGVVTADLGDLLTAVAVSAEGLQPRTVRLLGSTSSSRMSMHDLQTAQREDASTTRLFRNLWLYTAMHKLINPAAFDGSDGRRCSGAQGHSKGGMNAEWQMAAGRLGAVTPLLVVGTDSYHEADMVERLKVELGEQLSQAGSQGSASSLSAVLTSLMGGKAATQNMSSTAGQAVIMLPQPNEAVLVAFIVAVAVAELSRAALGPLPDLDDDPVVACPISVTLGYLKGVLPDGVAAAWAGAIVRRAAKLYIERLLALAAKQEQEEEVTGAVEHFTMPAPALAYAEQLALALIDNLSGGAGPAAADAQGTLAPNVTVLADDLLQQLLHAFPALYHSQPCYCGLLVELQQEEGDVPLGQVKPARHGLVWDRTKAWVQTAAEMAPVTTEALLHSFLTSSDSLPGATTPAWLANKQATALAAISDAQAGGDAAIAAADEGAIGLRSHNDADTRLGRTSQDGTARAALVATQAAFRRAADLLQICAAARRRQQLGHAAENAAYGGAVGLTRKLHYAGYVQGLMTQRGASATATGPGDGGTVATTDNGSAAEADGLAGADNDAEASMNLSVAQEIAWQLEHALKQPNPRAPELAMAQLSAAALLAVQPDAFSYSELGLKLLGALARAPLRHFTPDTLRLSKFTWCWVSVESPEVLVPLISSVASAWIWTLDQRVGLFSGGQQQQPGAAGSSGGADDASGGHIVEADDDSSEHIVHDEHMLQAVAAHFRWLTYLLETWAVVSNLRDGRTAAARLAYGRLLAASLQDPSVLSHHPAAVGAYFRLLTLGLVYSRSCLNIGGFSGASSRQEVAQDVLLMFDRILRAALLWFRSPPRYFARCTRQSAAEQIAALEAFMVELQQTLATGKQKKGQEWPSYDCSCVQPSTSGAGTAAVASPAPHPVWGLSAPAIPAYITLLQLLCKEELSRLRVWYEPLKYADAYNAQPTVPWREYVPVAWQVDPCLALSLLDHCPAAGQLRSALETLVVKHATESRVQALPKAALLLATAKAANRQELLRYLSVWAPGNASQGLQLLSGPAGKDPAVRSYAIKCLFNERPEKLVFYLPQLVQLLRGDSDGAITNFFLTAASHSDLFGHQLIWALNSEAKPPEEAFNPEVKRSGWQPPKDTGLWEISARVRAQVEGQMTPAQREYWKAEGGYFEQVTALSGYLYKFPKDERRAKLQEALAGFQPPRQDLYLPTNPEARVKRHIPSSGACMQSAAKVPILVAFDVEVPVAGSAAGAGHEVPQKMACIFKVGDDIRQDVLAIQVIKLLHDAFLAAGLDLYLRPYGCLPTGYECGIIEVVPNTQSRAALGELSDRGLHDIFSAVFGAPGSNAFERARENFIVSEAAYAVASYLLQAKDRHNGNIMLDKEGHIVHIDFGFILEISPGGNMGFESAAFKLSHEMTQVLDPGGRRVSPQLALFEDLVVRAYLAARTVAEPIIATVSLMAESGLPCFSRGAPIANLRQRFHLEMSDAQAAAFMRSQIADAYDKWTTGFYDYIQSLQNKIPY